MSITETNPRWLARVDRNKWKGLRTYVTESDNASYYCYRFYNQRYPGTVGEFAPLAHTIRADYTAEGISGIATISVYYETPRLLGKARLTIVSSSKPQRVTQYDEGGKTVMVEGPDPDGIHAWKVVKGSNIVNTPYPLLRLEAAAYQVDVPEIMSYMGSINALGHPNILGAKLGVLRMDDVRITGEWGRGIIGIDYFMSMNFDGWKTYVQSQKGAWTVAKYPVFEQNTTTGKLEQDTSESSKMVKIFTPNKERVYTGAGKWEMRDTEPVDRLTVKSKPWPQLSNLQVSWNVE